MARARLVCGECGAEISAADSYCPKCGAKIELEVPPGSEVGRNVRGPSEASRGSVEPRICEVCGHQNKEIGSFCEECGVRLPGVSGFVPETSAEPAKRSRFGGEKKHKQTRRFETWQVISGSVLALIVGYFVYSEVIRSQPELKGHVHGNASQESAAILQDIQRVQKAVDANPSDQSALLRLANLLHDNAMNDRKLLIRATDAYKKYLALNPGDPNARVDLGVCYYELARFDTAHAGHLFSMAVTEMRTAFDSNPDHQPAAFNLGIVNLTAGATEESNIWFKKAVEINPGSDLGKRAKNMLEQHSFPSSLN